jgi:hypothetical protein
MMLPLASTLEGETERDAISIVCVLEVGVAFLAATLASLVAAFWAAARSEASCALAHP